MKKSKSFRFSDEELALLEALQEELGLNQTEAVVAGLTALRDRKANEPSDDELVSMMAARLKAARQEEK